MSTEISAATTGEIGIAPRVKLGGRFWSSLIIVGLVGQLAWTVETMYLNVFVYDTITDDPTVLAILVAAGAITATIATLMIGAASDRAKRRRIFISVGYILWGLSTATFGFISVEGFTGIVAVGDAVVVAILAIVLLDCLMSFFGAGASDAAFNAWVTESTVPSNRGRVDSVLAIMPLIAMIVVFGGFDDLTQAGQWREFFMIIGLATAAIGVVAWFLIRDAPTMRAQPQGYLRSVVHGLRPSVVRANPDLYLTLVISAIVGICTQVFLPYLIIYVYRYLRIDVDPIVLACVLIVASVLSVLGGRVIDRVGKIQFMIPAAGILAAGLILMFFARGIFVILAGIIMLTGYMLAIAVVSATVRDFTPPDRVGTMQGLRMIFAIMIPMVVGPFIGAAVIIGANETYLDLGIVKQVPTPWIFLAAAAILILMVWPVRILQKRQDRGNGDA